MEFAKIFTVAGGKAQLVALLQPSEEDGVPEIALATYVDGTHVSFSNRITEVGEDVEFPAALLARMRELFEAFDQASAEEAYRAAVDYAAEHAAERRVAGDAADEDADDESGPAGVAGFDAAGGMEAGERLRGWMDMPMASQSVH